MTDDRRRDVGEMFRTTGALVRENVGIVSAAILVLTAIDVAGDRIPGFDRASGLPRLLAMLVFQYQLTLSALMGRGLAERGSRARLWAMLGLSIVSGLGILLGLVLLIIPGIYLLVRWSVATPILIGEGAGVFESLTRSGEEIRGRFWPVFGFGLAFWTSVLLASVAGHLLIPSGNLLASVLTNLFLNAGVVGYWLAAVAVYLAGRPHRNIAEVFA